MIYSDNGITFNYEEAGEGRPVLILHGNGPDHRMMMACMEPVMLQTEGYRRIYIDLPGMGLTPAAEWMSSSDDMLRAVEMMIEALIPGERFLLVGQSYGGYLARGLLRQYVSLIDGVFLLCPCVIARTEDRELPPHQVMLRDEELLEELTEADREEFESITVVQSRPVWERYNREIISALQLADEEFMRRMKDEGKYSFSFDPDLSEPYRKPTLILTGRQDSITGYQDPLRLLERFPHASFAVLDRAGHNLHLEQEHILEVMVKEWLNRINSGAHTQ